MPVCSHNLRRALVDAVELYGARVIKRCVRDKGVWYVYF